MALLSAAILTYLLTTRLEHRKWLRQERLQAYEGYISCLWKIVDITRGADKSMTYPKSLIEELTSQTDKLLLFCSKETQQLAEEHGKHFMELELAEIAEVLPRTITKFRVQARRELGTIGSQLNG